MVRRNINRVNLGIAVTVQRVESSLSRDRITRQIIDRVIDCGLQVWRQAIIFFLEALLPAH